MEIYKTSLIDSRLIGNSEFTVQVIQFLLDSVNRTNIAYHTVDGFEIVLNRGVKVFVSYKIEYTNSHNLIVQFKTKTDNELNITTIVIPITSELTDNVRNDITEFINEYLKENREN